MRLISPSGMRVALLFLLVAASVLVLPAPRVNFSPDTDPASFLRFVPGSDEYKPLGTRDLTAQAAYVADADSGIPMYATNEHTHRQVGSVVKVFTALVVADKVSDISTTTVTITEADMIEPGYTSMGLRAGDTLTVEQLLSGLLLPSGGDAAMALSRHVGEMISGSDDPETARAAFADAMNEFAETQGLVDSHFVNSDGRDDERAFTTAYDVLLAMQLLRQDPELLGIITASRYDFTSVGPEQRSYSGTSTMAGEIGSNGVLGGKTGSEKAAGGNVVLLRSTNDQNNTVIVAILGAELVYDLNFVPVIDTRWSDVTFLLKDMDTSFLWSNVTSDPTFQEFKVKIEDMGFLTGNPGMVPMPVGVDIVPGFSAYLDYDWRQGYPRADMLFYYGKTRVGVVEFSSWFQLGWFGGAGSINAITAAMALPDAG